MKIPIKIFEQKLSPPTVSGVHFLKGGIGAQERPNSHFTHRTSCFVCVCACTCVSTHVSVHLAVHLVCMCVHTCAVLAACVQRVGFTVHVHTTSVYTCVCTAVCACVCRVHVFVHACVRVYTCRQPLSWRPTERGLPVAPGRPFLTRRVLNWGPLPGSRDPPKASLSRPFICQIPVILFKAILQPK